MYSFLTAVHVERSTAMAFSGHIENRLWQVVLPDLVNGSTLPDQDESSARGRSSRFDPDDVDA